MSKYELLISNLYSEHYVLLWKINDQDQTGRQILINAHTGEIIKDEVSMPNISATVPFYGTFNLNDWTDGNGTTHLRTPANDIIIYEGLTNPSYPAVPSQWTNNLIPQTTSTS